MSAPLLAALESRLRPVLVLLPPALAIRVYARGRRLVLARLLRERPPAVAVPERLARTVWGLAFRSPIGNAAGMWKDGRGYELAARQGAGYFLAGTTTSRPRRGNRGRGVAWPFAPYPRSGAASNFLGLPNPGHAVVAERLATVARVAGCPLGASVAADPDPDLDEDARLAGVVDGLARYAAAGVDFLELNESCPNTGEDARVLAELRGRLTTVAEGFLAHRDRPLPVVVKLGCDTPLDDVPAVIDMLAELGFDGVDFGNTSTDYAALRPAIARRERRLYDTFVRRWGGGVSGRPLGERSLALVAAASAHLARRGAGGRAPGRELRVVRTGGVAAARDVADALAAGAALCGWYTGYFEAFAEHGHGLYADLYARLLRRL